MRVSLALRCRPRSAPPRSFPTSLSRKGISPCPLTGARPRSRYTTKSRSPVRKRPFARRTPCSLSAGEPVPAQQHDFASIAVHLTRVGADEAYSGKTEVSALDSARINGLTYDQVVDHLRVFLAAHPGRRLEWAERRRCAAQSASRAGALGPVHGPRGHPSPAARQDLPRAQRDPRPFAHHQHADRRARFGRHRASSQGACPARSPFERRHAAESGADGLGEHAEPDGRCRRQPARPAH